MADAYSTTSDVAIFNDSDLNVGISDLLDDAPLLAALAARSVSKNVFTYSRKTAAPGVGFRAENDGNENVKATYEQVTVTLGILDASFAVDVAVAESDERGVSAHLAMQASDHLRAALAAMESELVNGGDAAGFDALADQAAGHVGGSMGTDAAGTTSSSGSSVYLIRNGINDCCAVWGQEGVISIGDTVVQRIAGSSSGTFPAFYTPVSALAGLMIGSTKSVGRIFNITEDSGKTLTDDLIASALSKFPAGRGPDLMAMSRRSLVQLQQSRTATSASGQPAPFPTEGGAFGVPIIVTDSITDTEALLS